MLSVANLIYDDDDNDGAFRGAMQARHIRSSIIIDIVSSYRKNYVYKGHSRGTIKRR